MEKKDNKVKKAKKPVTSDKLVMLLIFGGLIVVLVAFIMFNFGQSSGRRTQAQLEEDRLNQQIKEKAAENKALIEKYKNDYYVVTNGETHESESTYDLSVYKKDYPLVNYAYSTDSEWQVVINLDQSNGEGTSLVCADTEIINKYCESLYTYISPYKNQVETENAIYVFRNGEIYELLFCERIYFTNEAFRNAFQEISTAELVNYMQ